MKKIFYLLLLSVLMTGCNNDFEEKMQTQGYLLGCNKNNEIKIEYFNPSIPVWKARFTVYDKNGNYAEFTVKDPFVMAWI